jgi:hypothetical protein
MKLLFVAVSLDLADVPAINDGRRVEEKKDSVIEERKNEGLKLARVSLVCEFII